MTNELQLEKPAPARILDAGGVERLCRLHFEPPHFAFLTQVRNGTGYSRRQVRTADAIAMGTWPSRGIFLHGIEIKVSHSDFVAELKNPEKAEDVARYCHFWWLAISRPEVAPLNEVPPNWGLLVASADGTKMKVVRDATKKDAAAPDHLLLAAIMRRLSQDYVHIDTLREWKDKARCDLEQTADRNSKYLRESAERGLKEQSELLAKIHETIGCHINNWSFPDFKRTYALAKRINENGPTTIAAIQRLLTLVKTFEPELLEISKQLEVKGTE